MINIFADPMDPAQVEEARCAARRAQPGGQDSLSYKVALWTPPILGIDMLAGLATAAVEYAVKDDPMDELRDVPKAIDRDWSASAVTSSYVEKVRSQGRQLIRAEVDSLNRYLEAVAAATGIAAEVAKQAVDAITPKWLR